MMYDACCFERWSDDMERSYLSRDYDRDEEEEDEDGPWCCECGERADVEVGGQWYCTECALELESVNTDQINTPPGEKGADAEL